MFCRTRSWIFWLHIAAKNQFHISCRQIRHAWIFQTTCTVLMVATNISSGDCQLEASVTQWGVLLTKLAKAICHMAHVGIRYCRYACIHQALQCCVNFLQICTRWKRIQDCTQFLYKIQDSSKPHLLFLSANPHKHTWRKIAMFYQILLAFWCVQLVPFFFPSCCTNVLIAW